MERTNVRDLTPAIVEAALGGRPDLVTVDLSFTSLLPHAATLVALARPGASLVALVKPQFEVDRRTASKGRGVVTDAASWHGALLRCASAFEDAGAGIMGAMASTILGASGNVEFFLHAVVATASEAALPRLVDDAIGEATTR
jgi:23S rRNA (cytidine1920-2'-O)/16S rRNA (cytidine1409-2'-O)-methyltransferase